MEKRGIRLEKIIIVSNYVLALGILIVLAIFFVFYEENPSTEIKLSSSITGNVISEGSAVFSTNKDLFIPLFIFMIVWFILFLFSFIRRKYKYASSFLEK